MPEPRPVRSPRLATLIAVFALTAQGVAGGLSLYVRGASDAPAAPPTPAAAFRPRPPHPGPGDLLAGLPRAEVAPSPHLGGPVHAVFAEAGRVLVVLQDGGVRALPRHWGPEARNRPRVPAPIDLGRVPVTCLPYDLASDGAGGACALVPCPARALCRDAAGAWTRNAILAADGIEGLSSARDALFAWRAVGGGAVRLGPDGHGVRDDRPAGRELLMSFDGGAHFAASGTLSGGEALAEVDASGPGGVPCVRQARSRGHLAVDPDCVGGLRGVRFVTSGPADAGLDRVITASGAVVAVHGGYGLVVRPGAPAETLGTVYQVPVRGVPVVASWTARQIAAADGPDLHVVDLVTGRRAVRAGLLPEGARDLAGLGRVDRQLVLVGTDGSTWVVSTPPPAAEDR